MGAKTRLRTADNEYNLGQIVALEEANRRLERGFDALIEALKNFDSFDTKFIECFRKFFDKITNDRKDNNFYLKGNSSSKKSDEILLFIQSNKNTLCVKNKKMFIDNKEAFEVKNLKRLYMDEDEKQLTFYTAQDEFPVILDVLSEDELELLQDAFDDVMILLKNEKI